MVMLKRLGLALIVVSAAFAAVVLLTGPSVAAPGWTFQGCAQLRPWTGCSDVFSDRNGDLWICGPCGTTKNPGPGKCRLFSDTGLWCS
jgi:hypothetical protein